MINNLLDVVVEFFWVEVVARRDQATPHKGYGSGKPALAYTLQIRDNVVTGLFPTRHQGNQAS